MCNRRIFSLLMILSLLLVQFLIPMEAEARTLGSVKQELAEQEAAYKDNENKKELTEAEIASTKARIDEITREKVQVEENINKLTKEIEEKNKQIDDLNDEIKSIVLNNQLSTTGQSAYMEYIFSATDYTDLIYRVAVAEQLSEYNEEVIAKYTQLIKECEENKKELEEKQVALDKLSGELAEQLTKLGSNLEEISEASLSIEDEIADLKQIISLYENTYGCKDDEEISACKTRYDEAHRPKSSTVYVTPSASGFYMPVTAGRVNANYGYSSYYGSTFHYGMDIGVSHGTPVYSIADGVVVKISPKSSCGGNMVYIAYNVNGNHYTAGFFHLASIAVSVGEYVSYNTIIGYSGGNPNIETWDRCSTGAHLHLQMGTGLFMTDYFWYANFQARAFDPRYILNFPAWGQSFQGR